MKNQQTGFTLIESMITVVLLVILSSIAVPSFMSTIASSQLTSATNDIVTALGKTRINAISSGTRTTICKSADGTQCANSGDWEQGWIIFTDGTRAGNTASVTAGEKILAVSQNSNLGNIFVRGDANLIQYVSFGADGTTKAMGGAPLLGTIRVCSNSSSLNDSNRARDISITFTGRTSVTKITADSTCEAPT